MGPNTRLWDSMAAPFRANDLHECVRLTRAAVDAQPYELAPRYLLASLYLALGESGLALLQYERLLPLAVGRGELFLALAAQRRLDELHPPTILHERRYHAMHQWFVSLARTDRKRRAAASLGAFGPHVLVRLTAVEFAQAAERCRVESLAFAPRTVVPESGLLWVVLHGRVRWTSSHAGEPASEPVIAEPGDLIVLPTQSGLGLSVSIEPETPAECLCLDPELFGANAPSTETAAAPEAAPDEQVVDLLSAATAALDVAALTAVLPPVASPAPERSNRPVPDPQAEPQLAVDAPAERRRETRVLVQAASGVVLLGLADTRVSPIPGALVALTEHGLSARFRRGDLLQARARLRNAMVSVHLVLAGRDSVERLVARVTWVDQEPAATDPESALSLGLEFVAIHPALQQRLAHTTSPDGAAA